MSDFQSAPSAMTIPFREYRNDDIADFFANESRTFQPPLGATQNENVASKHVVGRPNKERVSVRYAALNTGLSPSQSAGIDFCPKNLSQERGSRSEANSDFPCACVKLGASQKTPDLPFGKQPRALGSLLPLMQKTEEQKAVRLVSDTLPRKGMRIIAAAAGSASTDSEELSASLPFALEKALAIRCEEIDAELGRLVESWPQLPQTIRESIAALVDAAAPMEPVVG